MRNVFNPWRIYSLNDESGVMICTWPGNDRPAIPLPYHTETMHGFEWAFAAHLAMNGMMDETMEIVHSIRKRYDGIKRNPWNEIECGNNYARSMAAYALLPAISGFKFDSGKGKIGFLPPDGRNDLSCFWSLGAAWGTYEQNDSKGKLTVLHGQWLLKEFTAQKPVEKMWVNGRLFNGEAQLNAGDVVEIQFA